MKFSLSKFGEIFRGSDGVPDNLELDNQVQTRRDFLKMAVVGVFSTTVLSACNEDPYFCRAEADDEYGQIFLDNYVASNKYEEILLGYTNLRIVLNELAKIRVKNKTGFEIVSKLLTEYFDKSTSHLKIEEEASELLSDISPEYKFYILRVAQSLFVEASEITDWSLLDYSEEEIKELFYSPVYHGQSSACTPDKETKGYIGEASSELQFEIDATYQLYPIAKKLQLETQEDTIINVIRWMKTNFPHSHVNSNNEEYGFDLYSDGRADSERDYRFIGELFTPINLRRYFEERIGGCHLPTVVMCGILKSLNIPSVPINYKGHGMTYFPTLDRYIHGDNIASFPFVPAEDMLIGQDELKAIADDDSMFISYLYDKMDELYSDFEGSNILSLAHIERDGNTLYISYFEDWVYSPEIAQIVAKEAPQYARVVEDEAGRLLGSQRQEIRTLDEFSEPGVDVW